MMVKELMHAWPQICDCADETWAAQSAVVVVYTVAAAAAVPREAVPLRQ